MMMRKVFYSKIFRRISVLVIVCFYIAIKSSNAQVISFIYDRKTYPQDLEKNLTKSIGNTFNTARLKEFTQAFSTFSDTDKDDVAKTLFSFSNRGFDPYEVLNVAYCVGLYTSKGSPKSMTPGEFIKNLFKSFEGQSPQYAIEGIQQLIKFFEEGYIYYSNFNKVKAVYSGLTFVNYGGPTDVYSPSSTPTPPPTTPSKKNPSEDIGWGDASEESESDPWTDPKLAVSEVKNTDIVKIPLAQGLAIKFDKLDLVLISPSDSFAIQEAKGIFDISHSYFFGDGGKLSWMAADRLAKATFSKYYIKVDASKFMADHVKFDHMSMIRGVVEGVLEVRLEKRDPGVKSQYPRFKSYFNDAKLAPHQLDIEYTGGYTLIGNNVNSGSMFDVNCRILANKTSKNKFTVVSRSFSITDSMITSPKVSFNAKIDKDSISHPAVRMEYDLKNKKLQLNKIEKSGFKNSLFSDTFHQVDIKSDAMTWDLVSGKMDFYIVSGKTEVAQNFESFDYFNPLRIRALSTQAGWNPLMAVGMQVARKKVNSVTLQEMQDLIKKEPHIVANGMLIGHQMGFFDYDTYKNTYSLSRKGKHYFLAFRGEKDFDDLVLSSVADDKTVGKNASIDLEKKSLDIRGAQDFKLSDSLGIAFIPKDKNMQIVGNKVFTFKGIITVKNFNFYGDFEVQYENFYVNLQRIDSITFTPLEDWKKGKRYTIGGHYQFAKTGVLYLNDPKNKSGRKKFPEYPKLQIPEGVTVTFDESRRKRKYSKNVFFRAPKIDLDSLNTMDPIFTGNYNFNKIIKPIDERLIVLKDSTMGMIHYAKQPYNLYELPSTINPSTPIFLDTRGLHTTGEVKHIVSSLQVKDVTFAEDYSFANGDVGRITETKGASYYPDVDIKDFKYFWAPKKDSMSIGSEKGFDFYASTTKLKGNLLLNLKGLYGNGDLERRDIVMNSSLYEFKETGFTAQHAIFNVKAAPEDPKAVFAGKNMAVDFNIKTSMVNFAATTDDPVKKTKSQLEFPYSSYTTTIDKALWDINGKKITMEGELNRSIFASTLPSQYGLKFNGTNALYTIANKSLNISGVQEIRSADAAIIPPKGQVFIDQGGLVEAFTNARIIADTLNKYHTMTNANVKISSKLSFTGNATYQYVNVSSDTFNIKLGNFEFAEIGQDRSIGTKASNKLRTIAKANIELKDSLFLSPRILYRGEMTMLSPFKDLSLDGQVIPDLKKYPYFGGSWITYKGNKSEEISINVDESLRDGGKQLYVGVHMVEGAQKDALYPTFLSMRRASSDMDVFTTKGVFKRDEANKRFRIAPSYEGETGNVFDFYDAKGIIQMDGKFTFLGGTEAKIMESVGQGKIRLDSMKYSFESMLKFLWPMTPPQLQKLGQSVIKANLEAGISDPAILTEDPGFISKVAQYVGKKDALAYQEKLRKEYTPLFKFNPIFNAPMIISDVTLIWHPTINAYASIGKVGISNIGGLDINAQVDGYVEIYRNPSIGDEINVYLDISDNSWYYFKYSGDQLSVISSDGDFNNAIAGIGTEKEKKKKDAGNVALMEPAMADKYRKKFLEIYWGIKNPKKRPVAEKPKAADGTTPAPGTEKKDDKKDGF
ncbi:MAG: hypothetical protein ACRCVT_01510 [Leadbetterella sp.]